MNLRDLLTELSDRGIKLEVEGGQLRIQSPKGALTPDLREALTAHKAEILLLSRQQQTGVTARPLVAVEQKQNLPVSFQQERLWVLAQLAAVESAHNMGQAVRLRGDLDLKCLERSVRETLRRQEALRTTFGVVAASPVQNIAPDLAFVLTVEGLESGEDAFWILAEEAVRQPFDFALGPLWRVKLFRVGDRDHILLLVMHHIISDMLSLGLWVREIALLYQAYSQGQPSPLPELSVQYGDFAVWQRQWLNDETLAGELAYWQQHLKGASFEVNLPIDYPRPPVLNFQARQSFFKLDPKLWAAIEGNSRAQSGITPFMVFVAALKVVIYLCSNQKDILIGFTTSGRVHPSVETLLGFFGYPLLLRTDLSGDPTFSEVLSRVRGAILGAYAHQNVPFGKLIEVMGSSRMAQDTPFFQTFRTGLTYVNLHMLSELKNLPDLTLEEIEGAFWGPMDLDFYTYVCESSSGVSVGILYNTDLFKPETILAFYSAFTQVLEQWVETGDITLKDFRLPETLAAKAQASAQHPRKPALAIAATFTAEPIADALRFWMRQLQWPYEIAFAPYNQVFQELLAPDSLLSQNRTGINIILVRLEDWIGNHKLSRRGVPKAAQADLDRHVRDLVLALRQSCDRTAIPHLLCVLPPSPALAATTKTAACFERVEADLYRELADLSPVQVISHQALTTAYPVADFYDAHSDELGHIPFTPAFFAALGTALARIIDGLLRSPYKVIVLDCDQTLWDGICGEEGAAGVRIDASRQALQAFMVEQCDHGKLLCLCSKNDEADVFAVFERPEMRLKRHHFVSWRINWQSKAENLRSLAQELGLGLDSFIFIDDSPIECAEVRRCCPEVLTLQLPAIGSDIPQFLAHVWAFDALKTTPEDRQRTLLYQQNRQRQQVSSEAISLQDFLDRLEVQVEIVAMQPAQIDRVAQLTQRTNQFNTTTVRRSSAELQTILQSKAQTCYVVEVSDRFGDYGLVGMMMVKSAADTLVVESFLLSCRVLGRGVEGQMLEFLGELALAQGLEQVEIQYRSSAKNQPVKDCLERVGANHQVAEGYRMPAKVCRAIALQPQTWEGSVPTVQATPPTVCPGGNPGALFQQIATVWRTPDQILEAIKHQAIEHQAAPHPQSHGFVAPRTETERQVAAVWQTLLHQSQIGVEDNFFELGGNSLLAVQLLSQLRDKFQVMVPIQDLLEVPTVAGVAQALETIRQTGATDRAEIDLTAEAVLDPIIHPMTGFQFVPQPKAVFLTGATGFLGAYLLDELLRQTTAAVYCLVRSPDPVQGLARIQHHLQTHGLWQDSFQDRILPVVGDLALPNLGLSETQRQALSHCIDAIYHNGALVNFLYPYAQLKAANVLGTEAVLRLAAQTKVKPVHFVSTLGVFSAPAYANAPSILESDGLEHFEGLEGGYLQSKWVAEKLMMQARDRGLPVCIYRPGAITGHTHTGIAHVDDFFCSLTKGCIQLGMVPDLPLPLDLTPVDYGSRAIVQLSQQPQSLGKAFHLVSPQAVQWHEWFTLVESVGYPLKQVSYPEWRDQLLHQAKANIPNVLHAFLPLLDEALPFKAMRLPTFDCRNVLAGLAHTDIAMPKVDRALVEVYFAYFKKSGFLKDE